MMKNKKNAKRISPTKSEIVEIMNRKTDPVLSDDQGRIYGFLNKKDIIDELTINGMIDERNRPMWVYLPPGKRGLYQKNREVEDGVREVILDGDEREIPNQYDVVNLYDVNNIVIKN